MTLTGDSALAGIMGWPVNHSKSPCLHCYWLERYGIDGAYVPLPVHPDHFSTALRALERLGFRGVNVTLPHKEAALASCDRVDQQARRVGAVNTIEFVRGSIIGSNTDGFGFIENMRGHVEAWSADSGPAVVLGAGGAARAILVALLDQGVAEVRLLNRTLARAEALAATVGGPITVAEWSQREDLLHEAQLLVNTTSLGMVGRVPLEIGLDHLPVDAIVADIVYQPLETGLLAAARARGHRTVDGLGMLLHQARPGFEKWFGVRPDVSPELRDHVLSTRQAD